MFYVVALVLSFVLLICLFLPFQYFVGPRTIWEMRKIPGPKGLPLLGIGLTIATLKPWELLDYLMDVTKQFPRLAKLWVPGIPLVVVQQPEDIEVILGSVHHIEKGIEYDPFHTWLNEGLLISRGNKWHRRRKILTPTFHFKILQDNISAINKHSRILLRNLLQAGGEPVEIEKYITLCTLDVICDTAMGISLNAQENEGKEYVEAIKGVSSIVVDRVRRFWLCHDIVFNASSFGKRFTKYLHILHRFTEKIIEERKKFYESKNYDIEELDDSYGKKRKAFLDSMIEMDLKYPNSFTNQDIREEVDTFMFEGHDTTSAAVMFGMYLLGRHPSVQEKLYLEQLSIFGEDVKREPTMKDLQEMHYMEKVIKEILRLYPSVPYLSRMLTKDATLDENTSVPKGSNVIVIPYIVHRNERFFPNPEVFDPERFAHDESTKRHPYAYIPFSAGPRNCIGQKFAMMELKVTFSTLIRFSILETLTKPEDFKLLPYLILRTTQPIIMTIKPRSSTSEAI